MCVFKRVGGWFGPGEKFPLWVGSLCESPFRKSYLAWTLAYRATQPREGVRVEKPAARHGATGGPSRCG